MRRQTANFPSLQRRSPVPRPSFKRPCRVQRRVRFGFIEEIEAEEIHRLSRTQVKSLWFTRDEFRDIRKEIQNIIKESRWGERNDHCRRGLEMCFDKPRELAIGDKIADILEMQEQQKSDKIVKALALCLSMDDVRWAVLEAAQDAHEANQIYKEKIEGTAVDKCFS